MDILNSYKISSVLFFIKDYSANNAKFKRLPKHEDLEEIDGSLSNIVARIKSLTFLNLNTDNINNFYFFSETDLKKKNIFYNDFLFSFNNFLIINDKNPLVKVNSERLGLKLIAKASKQVKGSFSSPVKKVNFIFG